mgnify:CR=1 FL=1
MKATLRKDGAVLVEHVELALRLRERMKGLLGRRSLGVGRALYLSPCNSVHTFFMRFPLDLVFLDRALVVRRVLRNVPANRIVWGGPGARSVLEVEAGWLSEGSLKPGDRVELG